MNVPYYLHHVCIYDANPRENMWDFLRWYHAVPQYYWGGEEFHLTDVGHVDYTFLAAGSAFQVQLEAPPFQFEYEREWSAQHGSALNHICWIVPDAQAAFAHLVAKGCTIAQEYTEFGVYRGFVVKDLEGRWIEIMEYIGDFKTPDVEFRPFGMAGIQMTGATQFTEDLGRQVDWYTDVMDLDVISEDEGRVSLGDRARGPNREVAMILAEPRRAEERAEFDKHGPCIGSINYQAVLFERAIRDAASAGFEIVHDGPEQAVLRESSGNLLWLSPNARAEEWQL